MSLFEPPTSQTSTPAYVANDQQARQTPQLTRDYEPGLEQPRQAPDPQGVRMTPPQPPKTPWKLVLGGIVGVFAAVALIVGAVFWVDALSGAKAADVTITDCATSGTSATVDVAVTNSSDSRRSYIVAVDVMWIDDLMGDGYVYVDDVAPGQTVRETGNISVRGKGDECVITSVD